MKAAVLSPMLMKPSLFLSILIAAVPLAVVPVHAQDSPDFSVGDGSVTIPNSTVPVSPTTETDPSNSQGINRNQVIRDGTSVTEELIDGSFTTAASSAISKGADYLPGKYGEILNDASPYLGQLIRGGDINIGGVLGTAAPYISDVLGEQAGGAFSEYYGKYGGYLNSLLSGEFETSDLIGIAGGLIGEFFGGDNSSIFGIASGVLGGLLGGGSGSVELEGPLSGVFSDPVTSTVSDLIFRGSPGGSDQDSEIARSARILGETGSVLCLHNPTCVKSNPTAYRTLYANSAGAMGIPNPNEIRGQIAALSRAGVRPDAYTTVFNSEKNTYYTSNKNDLEISRARSEVFLSKEGQAAQKKAIEAARQTSTQLTKMSDECDKEAKASQDLIRCSMKLHTASTAFQAAQIAMGTNEQVDRQFVTTLLGNIQRSTDGLNKAKDVERSSMSARLAHEFEIAPPTTER